MKLKPFELIALAGFGWMAYKTVKNRQQSTGVGDRLSSFDDFDISYIKSDNRSIKEWALDAYNNFDTVRNVFQEKYGQMFINKLNPNEKRLWDAVSQEWANAAILKARNKAW